MRFAKAGSFVIAAILFSLIIAGCLGGGQAAPQATVPASASPTAILPTPTGANEATSTPTAATPSPTALAKAELVIRLANESFSYFAPAEGRTALGILQQAGAEKNFSVKTQYYNEYDSTLVTEIAQVRNGGGGKYWTYYVNGQFAAVGADKYQLQPGDRIEWKFEKSPYG